MSEYQRTLISQPPAMLEAFKIQAKRNGETLSAFLADCARANLDEDLAETLEDRPARGPRKVQVPDA
jgi:hypothetical protein